MKNLLVAILAFSLLSLPAMAASDGGKKKRKKAKTECKKDKSCKLETYDPKTCDPKDCDPKCCMFPVCPKEKAEVVSTEARQ